MRSSSALFQIVKCSYIPVESWIQCQKCITLNKKDSNNGCMLLPNPGLGTSYPTYIWYVPNSVCLVLTRFTQLEAINMSFHSPKEPISFSKNKLLSATKKKQAFLLLFCRFLAELGFELRASHLLGRHSYCLSHSVCPFCSDGIFWDRISLTVCLGLVFSHDPDYKHEPLAPNKH
jgi:hypothetical protein